MIPAQKMPMAGHLSQDACKVPTASLFSWQGEQIHDSQRQKHLACWEVAEVAAKAVKQETSSQAIRSWEEAKQSMQRMHTCASIFSSFHAVLGSSCAAGATAVGPCWLPSACGCTAAAAAAGARPEAAAGAGPSADGADTGSASGFGCSLAFSARSCVDMDMTQ